jgi:malto-oligosyltrehalose trehalohydrolase
MNEQRWYSMPFGTEIRDQGVLFRLWAPGAATVDLVLENRDHTRSFYPMKGEEDGWYRLFSPLAGPGSLYRFRIDQDLLVPDPASRCQAEDVHGPSLVVDPRAFPWQDASWQGRPWEEAVIYELHVGTFSPHGGFSGVRERLDYLAHLGVTALELMPVADFPGQRNWGYDGALLFAPDRTYGTPEDLKSLVQAAHARNMMVFLDVVYNHFGPEGNYLHVYARQAFFDQNRHTPWGVALNFSGAMSALVRRYFIDNALYWLEEYHLDGLRFDAVHAIDDDSTPNILTEIAAAVHAGPGRHRHIHLVLENDGNEARYLERGVNGACRQYAAQWNDDIHHTCHVLLTGEGQGYYGDYSQQPLRLLGRCLTEGFAYQGELSPYRNHAARGEPSRDLPLTAFVSFLQNHDQIGNRAFGERLGHLVPEPLLDLAVALLLLSPSPPLLFMGEEFGAQTPFLYFCDFGPELAGKVKEGRRLEFRRFAQFADPEARERIPDPNAEDTYRRSCLDWRELDREKGWKILQKYRALLALRRQEIVPRLAGLQGGTAHFTLLGESGLRVHWILGDGAQLTVVVNFAPEALAGVAPEDGSLLYAQPAGALEAAASRQVILPRSILWLLKEKGRVRDGEE